MNFAVAADELHRQEFARLAAAVTPRIEAFRSMTRDIFREEIAAMLERLGHMLISAGGDIVTVKDGRKYLTACAEPTEPTPTKTPAVRRLHEAVVAAGAARGFYVTPRGFTPEAEHYAAHAPIDLVDGALLIKSMQRSRKGILLPLAYRAMCRQCGEIVQHRLDNAEARPCGSGHLVAPTISRAALIPFRPPSPAEPDAAARTARPGHVVKPRNMSPKAQRRRAIRAHNHRLRSRAIRQRPDGGR
jgi:hypothetical protein